MKIKTYRGNDASQLFSLLSREQAITMDVQSDVEKIIADVKKNGDASIRYYTKKFDGVDLSNIYVTEEEISEAVARTDPALYAIMEKASQNIRSYHECQKTNGYIMDQTEGVLLGRRVQPLNTVGIYIPGGTAVYPSSVLMNAIPAKIAGVQKIVMVSPPNAQGKIDDRILVSAKIAGIDTILKVGGAQAIAGLAFGTETIPAVDKITGPGNIYVATAKRCVFGVVDIDMVAGPSEILVIADKNADPALVAIDLLSQAEHDTLSASILITTEEDLAQAVQIEIEKLLVDLPRKETAQKSLQNNGAIFITDTIQTAIALSDCIAPEHLELCIENPFDMLPLVHNAGSIFLGYYTPEALGDYFAGTNHILPTSGTARFSSGLSVKDFVKESSFIYYTKEALLDVADDVDRFAMEEGLEAHAKSVRLRKNQ